MLNNKFAFTTWMYRNIGAYEPIEVDNLTECGINIIMTPPFNHSKADDVARLKEYLAKAQEHGVQLILHADFTLGSHPELNDEEWMHEIKTFYEDTLESHPAVYGFFVSDEPNNAADAAEARRTILMMRKALPTLTPYINLMGASAELEESVFGGPHVEWVRKLREDAGEIAVSYDMYSQMVNDGGGTTIYFGELKRNEQLSRDAGITPIACLICSAHMVFRVPTEYDIVWQINTAAAAGYKGINWFRFYDSPVVPNYHGSPIDEFGYKTTHYYDMLRSMRRFSMHYGEIFMKLNRKSTFLFGEDRERNSYPRFDENSHDIIKDIHVGYEEAMVSFFEHEETGEEYMCVVNLSRKFYDHYEFFAKEGYELYEVLDNGAREGKMKLLKSADDDFEGDFLYPGQMMLVKIVKK